MTSAGNATEFREVLPGELREAAAQLRSSDWRLGTIIASDFDLLTLRYCFYRPSEAGWMQVVVPVDPQTRDVPSLTPVYICADRHEREIEDLFGITFSGHPRLGDFVLHNDKWAEDVEVMRSDTTQAIEQTPRDWQPQRALEESGAFVMPVGPVFSGHAESALFLLETVGEDVVRAVPRLFYKYRAIERLVQGRSIHDTLLFVERCNGTVAFSNGWGYCRAVEAALGVHVPPRAETLRTFLAELERIRHHAGAIRELCESTSLSVAASQAALHEEELLRTSALLTGHRYLFGMLAVGGLTCDLAPASLERCLRRVQDVGLDLQRLCATLSRTGSFLDRVELVGMISPSDAREFEILGPMARASESDIDLRKTHPYGVYREVTFSVPSESDGDGYARLRVWFSEIAQSITILEQTLQSPAGSVCAEAPNRSGSALGWVEAPRGASLHWVDTDDRGCVRRYHRMPPSFRNWHGFHIATEDFAFQDFPIILATLGLSVAENDR